MFARTRLSRALALGPVSAPCGISPRLYGRRLPLPYTLIRTVVRPSSFLVDEEIPATTVSYIDNNGVFHESLQLSDLLHTIDRRSYKLVNVNPRRVNPDTPVIVRLMPKEGRQASDQAPEPVPESYRSRKEKGKNKDPKKVLKEIEMSWAISPHDLSHRLKKMREFLMKGNRVSVMLGTKKGTQKQTLSHMEELVNEILLEAEKYGREILAPEGEIGRRYEMYFEGRVATEEERERIRQQELEEKIADVLGAQYVSSKPQE